MRQEELKRAMDESWREGRLFERARVKKLIDDRIKRCREMGTAGHLIVVSNLEIIKQKLTQNRGKEKE